MLSYTHCVEVLSNKEKKDLSDNKGAKYIKCQSRKKVNFVILDYQITITYSDS